MTLQFQPAPYREPNERSGADIADMIARNLNQFGQTMASNRQENRQAENDDLNRRIMIAGLGEKYGSVGTRKILRPGAPPRKILGQSRHVNLNQPMQNPAEMPMDAMDLERPDQFAEAERLYGNRATNARKNQFEMEDRALNRQSTQADIEYKLAQAEKARRDPGITPEQLWRHNDKKEQAFNTDVEQYGATLQRTGIPGALSVASKVLNLLPEQGKDIPGVGPMAGMMPNWAVSREGKNLRQAAGRMFNLELLDRSGVAVVDSEIERLKDEFGSGKWNTEQQFRDGVLQYVERLNEIQNNVTSSTRPDVIDAYKQRGGRDFRGSFNSLTGDARRKALPVGSKAKTIQQNGHTYTLNEQTGQYE